MIQNESNLLKGLYMKDVVLTLDKSDGPNPFLQDPKMIMKMCNSGDQRKIEWMMTAPMFDVYDTNTVNGPSIYLSQSMFHSFSNARARKERFYTGKVHVAVGFVDLSLLLNMDLDIQNPRPFQFVGFEMSTFSVAKTLVISSMLQRKEPGIVDAILQVWYSSCWNDNTVILFRLAVVDARKSCDDADVLSILNHWASVEPPKLAVARREWLEKYSDLLDAPANCVKLKARNVLIAYFLTGQLLDASVGSICMFSLPAKFTVGRARQESCFHSLSIDDLASQAKLCDGDFVAGAISHFRSGISKLNDLVTDGIVSISIQPPGAVSLDHPHVVAKIRGLSPYSMSWNNCLDYMSTDDFHRLARACSAPEDTVHFGYSINWPTNVKGACSLVLQAGVKKMLADVRNSICTANSMRGLNDLLISPPISNPINILDTSCRTLAYRYWTKAFFANVPNVGVIEASVGHNPFSRSNTELFMTWSYDPMISFQGLNGTMAGYLPGPEEQYSKLLDSYKSVFKEPVEDLHQWHIGLQYLQITDEYAGQALKIMEANVRRMGIGLPPPEHQYYEEMVSILARDLTEWMKSDRPDIYMGMLKIIADSGL